MAGGVAVLCKITLFTPEEAAGISIVPLPTTGVTAVVEIS